MFRRIRQYNLIDASGRFYRPRAYADASADGVWDGWLVFFPVGGGQPIATERETTQATLEALADWAAGLTPVYLEGALARALQLAHRPDVIAQLEDAEYEAEEDAERFETAARIERAAATVDEIAAAEARAEGERIRRERLVTESALATADAARRSGHAKAETTRTARSKKSSSAKRK